MGVEVGSVTLLEPLLDAMPTPTLLLEPGTARVVYANPAAERLAGGSFPKARDASEYAATYEVFDDTGRRLPGDEHPAVRAARGEQLHHVPVDWVLPDGRRSIVVSSSNLTVADGGEAVLVTFEDVTELQATRRRAGLLAEAGRRLVGTLDADEIVGIVSSLAVPAYADWCFVELLRDDGRVERVSIVHADPAKQALVEEYDRRYPLDPDAPFGSPHVIRTGEPELLTDVPDELLAAAAVDERQLELLREVGFRSSVVVPLRAGGEVLGDLALASAESGRRYGEEDVVAVQELADRAALALENARLYASLRDAELAARQAGEEVDTILGGLADAVTAQAPDGRLVYANDAAVAIVGYGSVAELLAAPPGDVVSRFEMLDETGAPMQIERLPGRRALFGEAPEPVIVRSRVAGTQEWRWTRVKATPVHDDDGRLRLAINVMEDITELKRAEQGERFLAEAGR
ncbi:MAG: hypothetical protein QOE28_1819, partial [Solirubrobacteraceae bacterium]|nr:hypothetical protein [Solirubrobacteraceae bacterium]